MDETPTRGDITDSQAFSIGTPSASAVDNTDYELLKNALMNEKASPEILPFEEDLIQRINYLLDHQVCIYKLFMTRDAYCMCTESPFQLSSGLIIIRSNYLNHLQEQEIQNAESSNDTEILRTMFTIEVTRVKYMLRSYLRTRILKIERYVMHCIDDSHVRQRLSQLEDAYALSFLKLVGNHLKNTVTTKLPGLFDTLSISQRLTQMHHHHRLDNLQYTDTIIQHTITIVVVHAEAFSSVTKQASAHATNDMIPCPDLGRHVFVRVLRDLGQVQVYEDGGMHELNKDDLYIMRYNMLREFLDNGSVQLI